jgi:tRNA threonylcarbamoyl adenosine modification protein YeaZ
MTEKEAINPSFLKPWLLLDTACTEGMVAIAVDGKIVAFEGLSVPQKHGESLPDAIENVLLTAGLYMRDLSGVAVGVGPGSFVGVRVAMAHAKGLCLSLGIPLIGVCTLSAFAGHEAVPVGQGVAFIDARRNELYARKLKKSVKQGTWALEPLGEPFAVSPADLEQLLATADFAVGYGLSHPKVHLANAPSPAGLFALLQNQYGVRDVLQDHTLDLLPEYCRSPDVRRPAGLV